MEATVVERLAFSQGGETHGLAHRRLTVFYGYFSVLAVCGAAVGLVRRFPIGTDPETLARLLHLQIAQAAVLCGVFIALRFAKRPTWLVRVFDAVGTLSTLATVSAALSLVPYAPTVDVTAVSFFILYFALRAALLPSRPWVATLTASASALPFAIGLFNLYSHAPIPDPLGATLAVTRTMAGGIAAVLVVSTTIYGLRRDVQRAVRLGQYIVHEKIGEGGMGTVYRASHAMLRRPTAVKLISKERVGELVRARFEREALTASRLSHPNNVAIYDFGCTAGGVFYYAMELLDGFDLERLVEEEGPLTVSRAIHVLTQLSAALVEAHDVGLVHRDIKPANVMLCTRGGLTDFVKVLDFGLVKDLSLPKALHTEVENEVAGTPFYLAPESILTPEIVGALADVYAVGCVAHFLVTGRPPFAGNSLVEICLDHVQTRPAPPSTFAPQALPEAFDRLVLACLQKEPALRPTMRALNEQFVAMERV